MIEDPLTNAALERLQEILGHKFRNLKLLERALTHSSYAHCQGDARQSNERLEFLGDAVLELCVSDRLFRHFPNAAEGELTSMRAALVNGRVLGEIASTLGITDLARKSIGAEWQGEKQRTSLGADALEAIIAAVYLDSGLTSANSLVSRLLAEKWPETHPQKMEKNPKNTLQEETMRLFHALPSYRLLSEQGPEHAKTFRALALLPDGREFTGEGQNRKMAEQAAAKNALNAMAAKEA